MRAPNLDEPDTSGDFRAPDDAHKKEIVVRIRSALLALPVALLTPLALPGAALAQDLRTEAGADGSTQNYSVELEPLNDSGVSGTALLTLRGHKLTVRIEAEGMVPNAPHAQHIHGSTDKAHDFVCPSMADDKNGDGILTVTEGTAKYGDINIPLTTKGDTSLASALAVDRMPKADERGWLRYERTIEVSDAVAVNLKNLHVVQHGIDVNDNGKYDFDGAGKSELKASIPQEATAPATCGMLAGSTMPEGGMETGNAGTAGLEGAGVLALGGVALVGAASLGYAARRRPARGEQG